mgnify:CR=1 FL=1
MSKAQTRASNKYHEKAYDRLYPFVPKGRKAEIQAAADAAGETLNEYIVKAIAMTEDELPRGCASCPVLGRVIGDGGARFWCLRYGRELAREKCVECKTPPSS